MVLSLSWTFVILNVYLKFKVRQSLRRDVKVYKKQLKFNFQQVSGFPDRHDLHNDIFGGDDDAFRKNIYLYIISN